MNVLIACDKFKGSLSATEACEAVQRGLPDHCIAELCPIADGGEGFVDALLSVASGKRVSVPCHDALGREVVAEYGLLDDGSAVIEMSAASGLWRLAEGERDIHRANTFGTGEMIRHASEESGAKRLLIGIGGSATNDAGAGMASALGVKFLDEKGEPVEPVPLHFSKIATIDRSECIALPPVTVACDVNNPLLGERGASAVFGPQKGATQNDVTKLERALMCFLKITQAGDEAETAGAGAAGGLGFGLKHFTGAEMVSGFELVSKALNLPDRIASSDLVITGEGSLDEQTLEGKGPAGVAALARARAIPVVAIAGHVTADAEPLFDSAVSLSSLNLPLETLMKEASQLVEELVRDRLADFTSTETV